MPEGVGTLAFNRTDVLDELALYPDRRERGMTRAELVAEMGVEPDEKHRLSMVLQRLSQDGYARKRGGTGDARWFITRAGMELEAESWDGSEPGDWQWEGYAEAERETDLHYEMAGQLADELAEWDDEA